MNMRRWFSQLSGGQRVWLWSTVVVALAVVAVGLFLSPPGGSAGEADIDVGMSIREIAPKLGVTGKALARELGLPLDVSKTKPLGELGVDEATLGDVSSHLLSHSDSMLKYYVYAALFLWGLVFLARLGRPDRSDIKSRGDWYPRAPYVAALIVSVVVAGFLLGKSPNPMESIVKVFKSMVGLYPDPAIKAIAFLFFIVLAVVGNKIICGWGCPFGALEELIYSIPILKGIKRRKLPFALTNTIRGGLFVVMVLFLFGIVGGRKGTVIYHYVNPFNLFNRDFESLGVLPTIVIALAGSFFVYRPFCQFICPFGFISWIAERLSIVRVRVDRDRCIQCGACIDACPLQAALGRVDGKKMPADCFSCARCLNVCPVDAIAYGAFPEEKQIQSSPKNSA